MFCSATYSDDDLFAGLDKLLSNIDNGTVVANMDWSDTIKGNIASYCTNFGHIWKI